MQFRHHPDGVIYMGGLAPITLAELLAQVPTYSLPVPAIGREYDAAIGRHKLWTAAGDQYPGPVPHGGLDTLLANATTIVNAAVAARPAPPAPPTVAELRALAKAVSTDNSPLARVVRALIVATKPANQTIAQWRQTIAGLIDTDA